MNGVLNLESDIVLEDHIKNISLGKKDSLENLYNSTRNSVFGFAFSILNNVTDAEDVMQDTYINILKYANMYDPRNKPLAWIFTITKNLCYTKIENKKKNVASSIDEIENLISNHSDSHYDKALIKAILEVLTDEERQIVILSSVSGFKNREIAKLLNLNLSTVLSKYHRAVKKIRAIYREEM